MMHATSELRRLQHFLDRLPPSLDGRLPPERELAKHVGLSRSRLRSFLARLEEAGFIRRHVGRGTFLLAPAVESLSAGGRTNDVGCLPKVETNPAEIMEARLTLEPKIAFLAAQRATGQGIDGLHGMINRMFAAVSWEQWALLDQEFHIALARQAGNQLLLTLLEAIQANLTPRNWGQLTETAASASRREAATREHLAIVDAVGARQAQRSAAAMRAHLMAVLDTTLGPRDPEHEDTGKD